MFHLFFTGSPGQIWWLPYRFAPLWHPLPKPSLAAKVLAVSQGSQVGKTTGHATYIDAWQRKKTCSTIWWFDGDESHGRRV